MGEGPPPLSEYREHNDGANYWEEKTTITVDRWLKASLDAERDGKPWNEYLEELRRVRADPLTLSEVDAIAEELIDTIGAEVGGPAVDDSDLAREVAAQVDYAELATQVADELEGRMR